MIIVAVNCFQCHYFFVTWDPRNPRGCKAYGFKTRELPSSVVKRSSGMDCLNFAQKKGDVRR
nr:uracil-DNA glycosylase [Sporosarcina limicola]